MQIWLTSINLADYNFIYKAAMPIPQRQLWETDFNNPSFHIFIILCLPAIIFLQKLTVRQLLGILILYNMKSRPDLLKYNRPG